MWKEWSGLVNPNDRGLEWIWGRLAHCPVSVWTFPWNRRGQSCVERRCRGCRKYGRLDRSTSSIAYTAGRFVQAEAIGSRAFGRLVWRPQARSRPDLVPWQRRQMGSLHPKWPPTATGKPNEKRTWRNVSCPLSLNQSMNPSINQLVWKKMNHFLTTRSESQRDWWRARYTSLDRTTLDFIHIHFFSKFKRLVSNHNHNHNF